MAIDITNDNRKAWEALRSVRDFVERVRKKKPVYSIHLNGVTMCSTVKSDIEEYMCKQPTKRGVAREVQFVPLEEVNRLRKTMTLGAVAKKLGLEVTVNQLKLQLIHAGYLKTNRQRMEECQRRNERIKHLFDQGYTFSMIKETMKLDLAETTIERICRDWD